MIHELNVFKILKIPGLNLEIKSTVIKVQTKLRPTFQCYRSIFQTENNIDHDDREPKKPKNELMLLNLCIFNSVKEQMHII